MASPETGGPAVQAPPSDLPRPARTGGPLMPPLMPPQPAWKQEARSETQPPEHTGHKPAEATPEAKPEDQKS